MHKRIGRFRAGNNSRLIFLQGCVLWAALAMGSPSLFASAWPVEREWTAQEEQRYSEWFEKLASKSWRSTNTMLHSEEFNTLYDEEDRGKYYYADCGDLPYIIRAYYAYKRRLPFVANYISGGRYTKVGNTTRATFDSVSHQGSAQSFFTKLTGVHSGNFRTEPDATDSFTYPIEISRESLRPGMVFYSPNGHVAMVAECRKDGVIKLIDAHPDQSVTRITFGPKLEVRSRTFSGGFRGYRTPEVQGAKAVWIRDNEQLPFFSTEQYDFQDYYGALQKQMMRVSINPITDLENYIREDTLQELKDRADSVDVGWKIGKANSIHIGSNIYDTTGDWENYSTPSRDLRLRLSYLYIPNKVRSYLEMLRTGDPNLQTSYATVEELGVALLNLKNRLFAELGLDYTNSQGQKVFLTVGEIEERLFRLSFDPNHAPELRWGAEGKELKTALRSQKRYSANYDKQQYWRNRMEKKQTRMAPNDRDNPRKPPPHDLSKLIRQVIDEEAAKPIGRSFASGDVSQVSN